MRPVNLQTLKRKPSPKMCWIKSSASNSVRSAKTSPLHEPETNDQTPSNDELLIRVHIARPTSRLFGTG
jgi:hypothetical protein